MNDINWQKLAETFKFEASPLRPHPYDAKIFRDQLLLLKKPLCGILLGVTKELAEIASDQIKIIAVDKSTEMIKHLWIGDNEYRTVKLDDWFNLPSYTANMDFVIGDGVFTTLPSDSHHHFLGCIRSILANNGLFIVRVFCSPEIRETEEEVCKSITNNFYAFKWRIAQTLIDSKFEVTVKDYNAKLKDILTPDNIKRFGVTEQSMATIEPMQNSPGTLSFITEKRFKELCDANKMEILNKFTGPYELGERCPIFVVRKF